MTKKERRRKKKEEIKTTVEPKTPFGELKFILNGAETPLSKYLKESDVNTFEVKRTVNGEKKIKTKYVLSYEAAKKLARVAGLISTGIQLLVQPSIYNKMTTYFLMTLTFKRVLTSKTETYTVTKIGESSDENTNNITKQYKGTTAEKRGFVRALIDYLEIPDMYGEDEIQEQQDDETKAGLSKKEFEELAEFINTVLNVKTDEELEKVGEAIKEQVANYSSAQVDYLRRLYGERRKALHPADF